MTNAFNWIDSLSHDFSNWVAPFCTMRKCIEAFSQVVELFRYFNGEIKLFVLNELEVLIFNLLG
jgi:hypothetical protein